MKLSEFVDKYGGILLETHRRNLPTECDDFFCNQWDDIHWHLHNSGTTSDQRMDEIKEELAHVPRYLRQVAVMQLADLPLPRCPECGLVGYLFYTNKEDCHDEFFDIIDTSCVNPDSVYETGEYLEDNQLVYALCRHCSIMWEY